MTQCVWINLCTTVAMGMTITNCRKLFHYGVMRDHYDKFIGTREFSERIDVYLFNNNFTTDTRTTVNNIPSLDEIDNQGTVYTCWRISHYSSSPQNSEISTISDIMIATAPTTDIGYKDVKEIQLEGGRYNGAARSY